MPFDDLLPVSDAVVARSDLFNEKCLGNSIKVHTAKTGVPDIQGVDIAIIGVRENRGAPDSHDDYLDFSGIRGALYQLFPGNWHLTLADLGDLDAGETLEDTFFAVRQITEKLIKQKTIPFFLGGSQDLTYAIYRGYDKLEQMVNIVNVASRFDLGDSTKPLSNTSYIGRIIVDKPYNLFNYSNLGYQTFLNNQDEIDLMIKLYFDAFRLGTVTDDISVVEPVLRDADLVSVDLRSIQAESLGHMHPAMPNGLNGREICAIARYAGLSDRVSAFGVFEYIYNGKSPSADALIAQMIWYFMEGVNFRVDEQVGERQKAFLHYAVPVDDEVLSFYKSNKTGRWWIEIPFLQNINTKLKRHTLLPCTHQDYLNACNQEIPERWFKARRKNEI